MPWEVVFHVCQDKTYKAAEEQTCRQSPSITECHGFGECSGYLWHRRVKSDGFFDAHCRVWNFTEILPLEKKQSTQILENDKIHMLFKWRSQPTHQSKLSLPSKTCMTSSLHFFWCSGLQARQYMVYTRAVAAVSWPANMKDSTSDRMSASDRHGWLSFYKEDKRKAE